MREKALWADKVTAYDVFRTLPEFHILQEKLSSSQFNRILEGIIIEFIFNKMLQFDNQIANVT